MGDNVQSPISGIAGIGDGMINYTFPNTMSKLIVSNDGVTHPLTVRVNGYYFVVLPEEVVTLSLPLFTSITVLCAGTGGTPFRIQGVSTEDTRLNSITEHYFVLSKSAARTPAGATSYKGNEFVIKKDYTLHSIGVKGSATTWEVWNVDKDHALVGKDPIAKGFIGTAIDPYGYTVGHINKPCHLDAGKRYALFVKYSDGATAQTVKLNPIKPFHNDEIEVTSYLFESNTVPSRGLQLTLNDEAVFDFKIEVN